MHSYRNLNEVCSMMRVLAHRRKNNGDGGSSIQQHMSISIRFNQNIFKRKLTRVFTNEFVMSVPVVKDACIMQSKHFPDPLLMGLIFLGLRTQLVGVNCFLVSS